MSTPNDPGMDYAETDYGEREQQSGGSRFWPACVGCFAGTLTFLLVLLVIGWYSMGAFVKFGIASDLEEYADAVKKSNVSKEQKKAVLDQIRHLKKLNDEGKRPSFWQWVNYSERIEKRIEDGGITEEDIADIIRHLKAMDPRPDD